MENRELQRISVKNWLKSISINAVDPGIYLQSLTHRSHARLINIKSRGNEQLEFLGDSILSFIITSYLYKEYGHFTEGKMAKIRAFLINKKMLSEMAREIKLGNQVLLSENEELCGGRKKVSILADSFEALIGAIYIDKGIDFVFKWVLKRYKNKIEDIIKKPGILDYKTYLQEVIQADYSQLARYKLVRSRGPDHDKSFYSVVMIGDKVIGKGEGKSKKESEQDAAKNTLKKIYNLKL
jgi:ribonuclease-3